jgi:hypothetical protein
MNEQDFEDIIVQYPELIEKDLRFIGRQVYLHGRKMDILFEDKFGRKLIIELKNGPIKDEHVGQIMAYEGMLLSGDDPTIRVMLVGTRVPPNIRKALDHHGIAWKEISHTQLQIFLSDKKDEKLLKLFSDEPKQPLTKNSGLMIDRVSHQIESPSIDRGPTRFSKERQSNYRSFPKKIEENPFREGSRRYITFNALERGLTLEEFLREQGATNDRDKHLLARRYQAIRRAYF